jgi:hypothetical protein
MKHKLLNFIYFFLLVQGSFFSQTKIIPYQQLPNYNGNATGSNMFFTASMNSISITITFEGPADLWIAL